MKDEWKNLSKKQQKEAVNASKKVLSDEIDYHTWLDEKNRIDEVEFCAWFANRHPMKYVGGLFYDIDGIMKDERLTKEIVDAIKPYVKSNIVRKAKQIVETLKYETLDDSLPKHIDRVHFKNGTYFLEGGFTDQKEFCSNRLPINYNANAKEPVTWLKFLDALLYPEDIATLQEFMGYCFIPTTKAQAMLIMTGNGGEGKSRISFVCRNLFGDNMNLGSIWKLSSDRFCLADQEGMLLFVDDDMKMDALSDTAKIKATVTMEDKMDLERKGQQSYQGFLYVRLMGFGNGVLTALYDQSDGFCRRQILIKVKEKPKDRVDDRSLSEKLALETERIAL